MMTAIQRKHSIRREDGCLSESRLRPAELRLSSPRRLSLERRQQVGHETRRAPEALVRGTAPIAEQLLRVAVERNEPARGRSVGFVTQMPEGLRGVLEMNTWRRGEGGERGEYFGG